MYTEMSPILAATSVSVAQTAAAIVARPTGEYTEHDIRGIIVPAYYELCVPVGVDPVLAVAQLIHETGNLTSFWASRPQRNPAGIGVNGRKQPDRPALLTNWAFNTQRNQWEMGNSFATWKDDAIPAHIGRLLAYALPKGAETEAQRNLIARALSYRALPDVMRGSAPVLKQLGRAHNPTGQGWASPGNDYGTRVAETANRILRTTVSS